MKTKHFCLIIALLCVSMAASAFGTLGHYITGQVAQNNLGSKQAERINAILNNATLPMVSNWADIQKSNPDFKETATWHYNNFESGLTRAEFDSLALTTDRGQNIYQTYQLIDRLQEQPSDTIALKMLIHLVEDLHCPMHFGRPTDRGGNDVPVLWFGNNSNLHSIWDTELIEAAKLSYSEYAEHLERQYDYSGEPFNKKMILDWAWANYQLAEQIYNDIELTTRPYHYMYKYRPLMEAQLHAGGNHLAMVLNSIYQ